MEINEVRDLHLLNPFQLCLSEHILLNAFKMFFHEFPQLACEIGNGG
jgi:hypothetical protein